MNDTQKEKYQSKKKVKNKIKSFLFLIIIASIYLIVPKLVLSYYESNGYSFVENIGHITQNSYDNSVETHNQNITFEYEVKVQGDSVSINDDRYDIVFSDNDIFDLGMNAKHYYMSIFDFYEFEFIFGIPFSNDDELVLSKSISLSIFNQIDSVGESININGVDFLVSGIVDEQSEEMAYIYTSSNNIERILNTDWTRDDFIFFKDDNLQTKLYERGGIRLVDLTETRTNQYRLISSSQIIISIVLLIVSVVNILLRVNTNSDLKKNRSDKNQYNYTKIIIKSFISITMFMIYSIILFIIIYMMRTTLTVAFTYAMDIISGYYWIFSIYAIPFLYIGYKSMKNKNSADSRQMTKDEK